MCHRFPAVLVLLSLVLAGCLAKPMVRRSDENAAGREAGMRPTPTATPQALYPQAKPLEEDKPVVIKSRHLRYNNKKQETVFTGAVTVRQGSTLLRTDQLTARAKGEKAQALGHVEVEDPSRKVRLTSEAAEYGNQLRYAKLTDKVKLNSMDPYGHSVTATGDEAMYFTDERRALLTGDVRVFREDITATAREVAYDGEAGRLKLSKGARVKKGTNRFKADSIEMRNKENTIHMQGKVQAVFIPEEVEAATGRR
jgi:lipopolysaccharide transport protein LptA